MSDPLFFRRCHICGKTNESHEAPVEKCSHCGRSLAPFYYFDDRFVTVHSDAHLRPPLMEEEYQPVHGLTVYWEQL